MFTSKPRVSLLVAALAISTGAAQATTITFDQPSNEYWTPYPGTTTFSSAEYRFDKTGYLSGLIDTGRVSDPNYAVNGTVVLVLSYGKVVMTSSLYQSFSVSSLDLANYFGPATYGNIYWSASAKITGNRADGSHVDTGFMRFANYNPDTTVDFTTVRLNNFTNLVSLSIEAYGDLDVDNIVIDNEIANVPEPASLALLSLGLVGFAAARRGKKRV